MKSRGLFPGPRSVPKRSFASAAGNSEYSKTHTDTGTGYEDGSVGWKAGRSAGGVSGRNRLAGSPIYNDTSLAAGEGGLAYDPSLRSVMADKGILDKDNAVVNKKLSRD